MAAGLVVVVVSGLLLDVASGQSVTAFVSTARVVSVTDNQYVGVNLDSTIMPISEKLDGLNLSSPKVLLLAKALSPSYFRIGGTPGDEITFDPTGHGSTPDNTRYTGATWDAMNKFSSAVGWDLIFGLNALKRKGLEWDPTNTIQLLEYTAARNYTIFGFELGNEPQFFPGPLRGKISGGQLGRDALTLKNILRSNPAFKSTLLIGPDSQGLSGVNSKVFHEYFSGIGALVVDRITVHHYYAYKGQATVEKCLDAPTMESLRSTIRTVYDVVNVSNPNTPVWFGETSSYWGGGAPGISDKYVDGFLWLDKLGISAEMGFKVVMRQNFYGSNYSLIEKYTFDPLPDYWLTLLYKRLVGSRVLSVTTSGWNKVRVYAHCTRQNSVYKFPPGSVTLYYLNIDNTTSSTNILLPQFWDKTSLVYSLTPSIPGNMTDKHISLNGKKLELVENKLPFLDPVKGQGGHVNTTANSFGFIVIPDANVDICR